MLNWILRRPKVSVIISTYNWSQALKLSIQSALQQSIKNIEVIVVGDACTDDSEMVTKSFRDKRLRWIGLQTNSGSQAIPNNIGIQNAKAELIAYHGHDDIWHPRHLEYLLHAVKTQKADYVYSGAILYGPPDTNIRMLTGFPIEQKIHFAIPPTTAMHRKNLVARIGSWKKNNESHFPIDYDFQFRARHAGVKFANTGKVSAFKFPAAWHRDSYQKKDVTRQSALLNKMRLNPNFLEEELLSVAKAADQGLFITNILQPIATAFAKNKIKLTFKVPRTVAPLEIADNDDRRLLGLAVHAVYATSSA